MLTLLVIGLIFKFGVQSSVTYGKIEQVCGADIEALQAIKEVRQQT